MDQNQRNLRMKQQMMQRQKQVGAKQVTSSVNTSLPQQLKAGNIGAINRVIWPFWFTFSAPELAPQTSSQGFFTVTQEAAFVWMAMTRAVYKKTVGPTEYTYVDPNNYTDAGQTHGLKWSFRDAQSSRVFSNLPVEMDNFGSPEYPMILPTPILFLPNSTVEVTYQNDNTSDTYVPFITMFGYRVRVEDAKNLLGTVVG